MDAETRATLRALFGFTTAGFLASPPGLDGNPGLGIAGVTGAPQPRGEWDVAVSATAPDLPGEELTFVGLADGTLVVDDDIPEGSAVPLAEAVEQYLPAPYRAAALRKEGAIWAVAAATVTVLELSSVEGDTLELARIGDGITFSLDGTSSLAPLEVRRVLDGLEGDVAVTAERIDGGNWVAQVWHL
jgi:hypothetical protein